MENKLVVVYKNKEKKEIEGYNLIDSNENIIGFYKYIDHKSWHEALQEAPSEAMIDSRDIGNRKKSNYVPITVQEALADIFFKECDIVSENLEVYSNTVGSQLIINIKLQILPNYPNAEHRIISGIASKFIQTNKNSLEYISPATQSAAKSNALTNFANIFGRNLNRKFNNNYSYSRKKEEDVATNK